MELIIQYARSKHGLWVRADRDDSGITIRWAPRHTIERGRALTLDAQRDVVEDVPVAAVRYGVAWQLAGRIPWEAEALAFCGPKMFDRGAVAAARHAIRLIAAGYGEDPGEVAGWFRDLAALAWIVDGSYEVLLPAEPPWVGFDGERLSVRTEDGVPVVEISVARSSYEVPVTAAEAVAFLVSTQPVVP